MTSQYAQTTSRPARYRNRFEVAVAEALPKSFAYEGLSFPYVTQHVYTPDFVDPKLRIMIEAKGYLDQEMRSKYISVKKQHPSWRIIFVFQNSSSRISPKSRTTYKGWALKNGFEVIEPHLLKSFVASLLSAPRCDPGTGQLQRQNTSKPSRQIIPKVLHTDHI